MRRLRSLVINAPQIFRTMWGEVSPFKLKTTSALLYTSSIQGDSICNGTHSSKKALLSDPQLFEAQFDELVTELSERDLSDPALADALSRLREVCMVSCFVSSDRCMSGLLFHFDPTCPCFPLRFWCTTPLEARGTEACLWLAHWGSYSRPLSSHRRPCRGPWLWDGALSW